MQMIHLYTYLICGIISLTQAVHLGNNDPHGNGCYVALIDEVISFDCKVYMMCKQYECTTGGLQETGEMLAGCTDDDMMCWDWIKQHSVSSGSTLYHRCNQYMCSTEDWFKVDGKMDPRCTEKNMGCKNPINGDIRPFGMKSYYKCEQFECTETGHEPTGNYNPGCNMSETRSFSDLDEEDSACFDFHANKPIKIGDMFYHDCMEYKCTKDDLMETGEKDPRCM